MSRKVLADSMGDVVEFATNLWVAIVVHSTDELLPQIYKFFDKPAVFFGILNTPLSLHIRKIFAEGVYQV